jgi:hypothetical protein
MARTKTLVGWGARVVATQAAPMLIGRLIQRARKDIERLPTSIGYIPYIPSLGFQG